MLKFGGINSFGVVDKTIEKYDISSNRWKIVNCYSTNSDISVDYLINSMSLEISENQVLVFGGKNWNGF